MLPFRLLRQPITVVKPAETQDRYGTTILDWDNATRQTVLGDIQPRTSSEDEQGRSLQVSTAVLYLRPNAPLTGRDRVEAAGVTYQVLGPPQVVARLGEPNHMVVNVRAVEG